MIKAMVSNRHQSSEKSLLQRFQGNIKATTQRKLFLQ